MKSPKGILCRKHGYYGYHKTPNGTWDFEGYGNMRNKRPIDRNSIGLGKRVLPTEGSRLAMKRPLTHYGRVYAPQKIGIYP